MEQTKTSPRVSDNLSLFGKVDDICRTYSNASFAAFFETPKRNFTSMVNITKGGSEKNEKTASIVAEKDEVNISKIRKNACKLISDADATIKPIVGLGERKTVAIHCVSYMEFLLKSMRQFGLLKIILVRFARFTNQKQQGASFAWTIATIVERYAAFCAQDVIQFLVSLMKELKSSKAQLSI